METSVCASCKEEVVPSPPKGFWKVANVAFWVAMLLVGTAFGLIIGLNVLLVPVWCFMAGAVGVTADRASSWTCPECHAEMYPTPERAQEILAHRHRFGRRLRGDVVRRPAPAYVHRHA